MPVRPKVTQDALISSTLDALDMSLDSVEDEDVKELYGTGDLAVDDASEGPSVDQLAGLNEGVWPEKTPPDAFLPRRFRPVLGLSDPDERLGLSAHDFAQLACAPRVAMLYAARRDDAPAVASRWVWRLRTLTQGALFDAADDALNIRSRF